MSPGIPIGGIMGGIIPPDFRLQILRLFDDLLIIGAPFLEKLPRLKSAKQDEVSRDADRRVADRAFFAVGQSAHGFISNPMIRPRLHPSTNKLFQLPRNIWVWLSPCELAVLGCDADHKMLGTHVKRGVCADTSEKLKRSWRRGRKRNHDAHRDRDAVAHHHE